LKTDIDVSDLIKDPNVDVIYVATPHSHHYNNVKDALSGGKHVLCEKPFTGTSHSCPPLTKVNAKQAKILVELARKKNRFLLEAVWTRFFPISSLIRDTIATGTIGTVHFVFADSSFIIDKAETGLQHRAYNPDLAGGSLLDLGVYSITWVMQTIYDAQKKRAERPSITGSLVPVKETGVDESATVILTWKDGTRQREVGFLMVATGIATSGIASPTDGNGLSSAGPAVKIVGTKGTITIPSPTFRPTEFTIHLHDEGTKTHRQVVDIPGKGMHWQADATARAISIPPQRMI
jgi:predicted dehydrogenase